MAAPDAALGSSQPLRSTYNCTGVAVTGLPSRAIHKSRAKYFVRMYVDDKEEWTSREIRTRETKVMWDADEDEHDLECAASSALRVTLYKNHSGGRQPEEVGSLTRSLQGWMQADRVGRLVPSSTSKDKLSIMVELSLNQSIAAVPNSVAGSQEPVENAEGVVSAVALPIDTPGVCAVTATISTEAASKDIADSVAAKLGGLLDKLRELRQLMDAETEVQPYLKMSLSILSTITGVADLKQEHSHKLKALIEKIKNVHGFVCDTRDLRDHNEARVRVLSRLALQTVECAYFISSCLKDSSFMTRLARQSDSSVSSKIDEYSKSFDDLLKDFTNGSQIRTEIATMSVLQDVKRLEYPLRWWSWL
ncbi:hypothetical protein CALCODRAFT_488152 [Calocera cornea HHB12733]|uniref:Uncharacterized protein n=1 Tax=Calocera cornea HHB12733 TaxID=1353952 RepID=A0A165CPE3_9BASI|nr:hypothetical protein CALCODRAFT_488152 [Calocera cornea HHB12733]